MVKLFFHEDSAHPVIMLPFEILFQTKMSLLILFLVFLKVATVWLTSLSLN